jgi:hypothetical protein
MVDFVKFVFVKMLLSGITLFKYYTIVIWSPLYIIIEVIEVKNSVKKRVEVKSLKKTY